jgi:hypothetical protein
MLLSQHTDGVKPAIYGYVLMFHLATEGRTFAFEGRGFYGPGQKAQAHDDAQLLEEVLNPTGIKNLFVRVRELDTPWPGGITAERP